MKRLSVVIVVALGLLAVGGLRRIVVGRMLTVMEFMMEHVMPTMMNSCFAAMSPERRDFMLDHCRGMLDQMEAKYVAGS